MKNYSIFLILFISVVGGCEQKTKEISYTPASPVRDEEILANKPPAPDMIQEQASSVMETASRQQQTPAPETSQMLIQKAEIRMQVKDYTQSTRYFEKIIAAHQAYITNSSENRAGEDLENTLEIRVDHTNFQKLLTALLRERINLVQKNITAMDVTEEFIDVTARLNTKKKVEARYLDLLAQAKNVREILAIENELRVIREEVEATEARQRYLKHQTAYSTIRLNYYQTVVAETAPGSGLWVKIVNALQQGWQTSIVFLLFLIQTWPVWLLGLPAFLGVRRWLKRKALAA